MEKLILLDPNNKTEEVLTRFMIRNIYKSDGDIFTNEDKLFDGFGKWFADESYGSSLWRDYLSQWVAPQLIAEKENLFLTTLKFYLKSFSQKVISDVEMAAPESFLLGKVKEHKSFLALQEIFFRKYYLQSHWVSRQFVKRTLEEDKLHSLYSSKFDNDEKLFKQKILVYLSQACLVYEMAGHDEGIFEEYYQAVNGELFSVDHLPFYRQQKIILQRWEDFFKVFKDENYYPLLNDERKIAFVFEYFFILANTVRIFVKNWPDLPQAQKMRQRFLLLKISLAKFLKEGKLPRDIDDFNQQFLMA